MDFPRSTTGLNDAMIHALPIVRGVCQLAGPCSFIDDTRVSLKRQGVIAAVGRHDTESLFNWLMSIVSFQGIADSVAQHFMDQHGNVTWADVQAALDQHPQCSKLSGYWRFNQCRYRKAANTCSEPALISTCPLPRHPLRNGNLNQTAYSLYLFIRDIAEGDLVRWIDDQLGGCGQGATSDQLGAMRASLVEPMREIFGISDKVVTMTLSSLLIGAGSRRRSWFEVGASYVIVDTLVHNFLHRTGILRRFEADHAYGAACYQPNGCASIIERISDLIDARTFNRQFPKNFPRFVQLAIWRYCSQGGLDICNGNRIDDQASCQNRHCQLNSLCDHAALQKST
jgi:hypothetical protein